MSTILYDPASRDLAEHFILWPPGPTRDKLVHELAQVIQQAIEDWTADQERLKGTGR